MNNDRKERMQVQKINPQTSVYVFPNEEHTLGGLIRTELLKNPSVLFAAYTVEKSTSLSPTLKIQVKTATSISPTDAMNTAVDECIKIFKALRR